MTECCQCAGIEQIFGAREAKRKLRAYRRRGPARTTQMLIEALESAGVVGLTHLDIGGGVGAIQHALLNAGAVRGTSVEASRAYAAAAAEEASRRGLQDRITLHHGDFVDLAESIDAHDVVTLDRVICCYHDLSGLLEGASVKARRIIGLVYPPDTWWMKVFAWLGNLASRLTGSPFRIFVHPTQAVEGRLARTGFTRRSHQRTLLWQVAVFSR